MPPRLARLLAVLVAAGLVAGAFVLRGALADDDEGVTAGPGGGDDEDVSAGPYRVLCDEDLGEAACDALADIPDVAGTEVLSAGEVLALPPGELTSYDAWLTLDPLPGVLDEARRIANEPPATSGDLLPVAASQLTLLSRAEVACEGEWDCVLDVAEEETIGVPSAGTAAGIVTTSAAFAAVADLAKGIRALDDDDNRALLDDLVGSGNRRPLNAQRATFLTQVGSYAAILTTTSLADAARRGARGAGLASVVLEPPVTVGVVLAGLGANGAEAVRALASVASDQTVIDALADAGWEGGPAASDGLPDPDVIYALQEELG